MTATLTSTQVNQLYALGIDVDPDNYDVVALRLELSDRIEDACGLAAALYAGSAATLLADAHVDSLIELFEALR